MDLDSLVAQAGGTIGTAPPDFDSLLKQVGGTIAPAPALDLDSALKQSGGMTISPLEAQTIQAAGPLVSPPRAPLPAPPAPGLPSIGPAQPRTAVAPIAGQLEPGNIDLKNRPHVKNPDGTTSTVRSISVGIDGQEVLIPTVSPDGRVVSDDEAVALYRQTGAHLGKFDTPANATAYAQQFHNDYAAGKYDQPPATIDPRNVIDPKTGRIKPFLDVGAASRQVAKGAGGLASTLVGGSSSADQTMADASDLLEGVFKLSTPFIAAAGTAAPLETTLALIKAGIAAKVSQKAAAVVGAGPEAQRLAGNVAALASGAVSGRDVLGKIQADAKAVMDQARAFDAANPEPAAGPVAAGAGRTPAAQLRRTLPEQATPPAVQPSAPELPKGPAFGIELDAIEAALKQSGGEIVPSEEVPHAPAIESPVGLDVQPKAGDGEAVGPRNTDALPATAGPGVVAEAARVEAEPAPAQPVRPEAVTPPLHDLVRQAGGTVVDTGDRGDTVDTLDTGEQQPRLPEAGAVRETSAAAPDVADLPFALERQAATRGEVQPTLQTLPEEPPTPSLAKEDLPAEKPTVPVEAKKTTFNQRNPPNRAPVVEAAAVTRPEQQELRRMAAEMESIEYSSKNFTEQDRHGGTMLVHGGAAGAPVYWDIVGGSPDSGQPTFRYTRGQVLQKLRRFVDSGERSIVSDLAVDVAKRRLAGAYSVSKPVLGPDAGFLRGRIETQKLTTLPPAAAAVQDRAAEQFEDTGPALIDAYREKFGTHVNADQAKELLSGYATPAERTANDLALSRPGRSLARAVFDQVLQEPAPDGKTDAVVFLAGGTGSGKSTALDSVLAPLRDQAQMVYDSTFSNREGALRDIEKARAAGKQVVVVLVDREIGDAWRGVLTRGAETGRPVTVKTHLRSHVGAQETFDAVRQDPGIETLVVTNGADGPALAPVDAWTPRTYNESDVRPQLEALTAGDLAAGRISPELATALRGQARPAASAEGMGGEARQGGDRETPAPLGPTGTKDVAPPKISYSSTSAPRKPSVPVGPKTSATGKPAASAGGTTLDMGVVPGGRQFLERDVEPALKDAFQKLLAVKHQATALLSPATVSEAGTLAALPIRTHKAIEHQELQKAYRLLEPLIKAWDKVPRAQQRAFAVAVDEGRVADLPAWQQDAARALAAINDVYRKAVSKRGGFQRGYIEHYFPRQWNRPGKVREWIGSVLATKRPWKGRQGFKKARARKESGETFTFQEMLNAGFTPIHENPVEAHLAKWAEMRKWISAYDILREHKQLGVAKFVPVGVEAPEGWKRYPESYGRVYGKPTVIVREAFDPLVRAGLNKLLQDLRVRHERSVNIGGGAERWGYAMGDVKVASKFGGPEGVIMHELGHILDNRYGLWDRIVKPAPREPYTPKTGKKAGQTTMRAVKQDRATVQIRKAIKNELRALADLRFEGQTVDQAFKDYVRKSEEKMANLVHAFLYAPQRAKDVAPNSYWALFNIIKEHPELQPLHDIQQGRGVSLGSDTREVGIGGAKITGDYYGPPDAVRIVDRYLSPGLAGSKAFQAFRIVGGALTQVQLGLSAFHVVTTGLEAIISTSGLGLEELSRGQVARGLGHLATSPFAPFVNLYKGGKALEALRTGDARADWFGDAASQIVQGGGREGWDPFWHNETAVAKWRQTWRNVGAEAKAGNYPGAAGRVGVGILRTFPMLVEAQAKPIMEHWVPRMKMAAFLDRARLELDDLGPEADLVEGRKALAAAWDNIDNRFGELIYDNLFWDRRMKDFTLALMRAPGWLLGNVREFFLAAPEQLAHLAKLSGAGGGDKIPMRMRHVGYGTGPNGEPIPKYEAGRAPWLTAKFANLLSALFWVATFGALYQYLHTGKKPGEQDDGKIDWSEVPMDLYFPRRDQKPDKSWNRTVLPSMMRDVWAASHNFPWGVGTMMSHKLNALVTLTAEFLKNEDYWGTQIRNPEETWPTQVKQAFGYLMKELRPISVQSFERGVGGGESAFGFSPAPSYITRTDLENYLRDLQPPSSRTLAQAAQAEDRRSIRDLLRQGNRQGAADVAKAGGLTQRQVQSAVSSSRLSTLQRQFQSTTLEQAIHGYELATPEERRDIRPVLLRKVTTASVAPADRARLQTRAKAALALPVAGAAPKPSVPVAPRAQGGSR